MSEAASVKIPPAPPLLVMEQHKNVNKESGKVVPLANLDECIWAENWPELQKACYLARVCQNEPPKKCQYRNILSQLQNGPTCGLTALSMLLDGTPTSEELLQVAKHHNFTNNGELFSAQSLFELVEQFFVNVNQNNGNTCQLYNSSLECDKIRRRLLEGACLFVPYPFCKTNHLLYAFVSYLGLSRICAGSEGYINCC